MELFMSGKDMMKSDEESQMKMKKRSLVNFCRLKGI